MKIYRLLSLLALLAGASLQLAAQALPVPVPANTRGVAAASNATPATTSEVEIRDGGVLRRFEVADAEVAAFDAQGHAPVARLARQRDLAAMRAAIRTLEGRSGRQHHLVLYEKGAARNPASRRLLTDYIVARLDAGIAPATVAAAAGVTYTGKSADARGIFLFETTEPGDSLIATLRLRQTAGVLSADPMLARQQSKKWVPNDPYFNQQWHLRNTGQNGGTAGIEVNLLTVWDTLRGTGLRIGIIDDGLQTTHPDLAPAVDTANDYDWNGRDSDPNPSLTADFHGTSCAGVAAGRGNNGVGISGAAPEATLVGLRLIGGPASDADEADALAHLPDLIPIKSNSWGPADDGKTLAGPGPLTAAALQNMAETGRGGKGTIFTWAGGNGGNYSDNSNYDGYANSIYTIAVGALSDRGAKADYSEPGANLVISAPSSSSGRQGITTADLTGNNGYNASGVSGEMTDVNYTQTFGGTSSATPLVSGVLALVLQANPNLGWRDVQEILIRSAKQVTPTDADWVTNTAGFKFNHKFGAGMIDAAAAVALARTWTNLPAQRSVTSAQTGLNVSIPDNNATGITRTFAITDATLRVEHVTLKLNLTHTYRGNLEITLTSPSGIVSRLAEKRSDSGDHYSDWTFMTVRNWGESAAGTWTLKIADRTSSNTGALQAATLTLFGANGSGGGTPPPPPPPPPSGVLTFAATGLPLSIPDNNATGLTSNLSVTATGNLTSVAVSVDIAHTYKGDLKVSLLSPAGTEVVLHNNSGGAEDNVLLSDVPVTAFNGQAASGTWKLKVVDSAAQDVGTLRAWSVKITSDGSGGGTPPPPPPPPAPTPVTQTWNATGLPLSIPDNNATGVTSTLNVTQAGSITALAVSLNITHTYKGDLKVTLTSPAGTVHTLHANAGGSADNVVLTGTAVTAFNTQAAAGAWKLKVVDNASADTGAIQSWSLQITTSTSGGGTPPPPTGPVTYTSVDVPKSIPDNNATGVTSNLPVAATGNVVSLQVSLNITHTYKGDLRVSLLSPAGSEHVLHANAGGSADNVVLTASAVTAFNGQPANGTWRLKIVDNAASDTGTLTAWSLLLEAN